MYSGSYYKHRGKCEFNNCNCVAHILRVGQEKCQTCHHGTAWHKKLNDHRGNSFPNIKNNTINYRVNDLYSEMRSELRDLSERIRSLGIVTTRTTRTTRATRERYVNNRIVTAREIFVPLNEFPEIPNINYCQHTENLPV